MIDDRGDVGTAADGSPLERALTSLIAGSTWLKPDELSDAVATAGKHLGGRDTELCLVDLSQHVLQPFGPGGSSGVAHLVDGDGAGAAYRNEAVVTEQIEGGTRLWIPILDSAERVGVLGTTVDRHTPSTTRDWSLLASLVGELVVAKSRYGDALGTTRRTDEVTVAAELRWALLPPLTYTSSEVVVSGILEPAHDIAGDTFDYAVNDGTVWLSVFDAMGHGLLASRMASLAVATHRNSRRRGQGLVENIAAMDQVVREQFGDSRFVTAHVATLDLDSGILRSVTAGHPPAVVFHTDGTHEELPSARTTPLGIDAGAPEPAATQLREGDVVLLHTDGVDEARSPSGEFFGTERLYQLFGDLLSQGLRPAEVLRTLVATLLEHQRDLQDDATLLLVGWRVGELAIAPSERGVLDPD